MSSRWLVLIALVPLLCVACTGTTIKFERTIEQTALVAPPSGPAAKGQTLEKGEVSLEGSYQSTPVFTSDHSRHEGETGEIIMQHLFRGRVGIGSRHLQMGLSGAYANAAFGDPVAEDSQVDELETTNIFRFGADMRIPIVRKSVVFGLLFEGEIGNLPYKRSIYERASLLTDYSGPDDWWNYDDAKERVLGERASEEQFNEFYLFVRAGLFADVPINELVALNVGALVQNQPNFFGSTVVTEYCEIYTGGCACIGEDPDDVPPYSTELVGTLFAALSVHLDQLELVAQVFGHPLSSNYDVVERAPFGGDLGVRLVF